MLRHLEFNIKDVQSTTIVHLLLRLEPLFAQCAVSTYNLWKPGERNQRLELVIRDYLRVFKEIIPAGLSGIARQELSMGQSQRTSRIEKFPPVCGQHGG